MKSLPPQGEHVFCFNKPYHSPKFSVPSFFYSFPHPVMFIPSWCQRLKPINVNIIQWMEVNAHLKMLAMETTELYTD